MVEIRPTCIQIHYTIRNTISDRLLINFTTRPAKRTTTTTRKKTATNQRAKKNYLCQSVPSDPTVLWSLLCARRRSSSRGRPLSFPSTREIKAGHIIPGHVLIFHDHRTAFETSKWATKDPEPSGTPRRIRRSFRA